MELISGLDKIDQAFDTRHHFGADVYAKEMHIPAGWYAEQHVHSYDHLSILASGAVMLEVGDLWPRRVNAPACLEMKAGVRHRIVALEPSIWFCIHPSGAGEPDEVAVLMGGH